MADPGVLRLPPLYYAHILDTNTNLTSVIEGPTNYAKKAHEMLVAGPYAKIQIPAGHYCVILNPVVMDKTGAPEMNEFGMQRLRHAEKEVRTNASHPKPFLLFPGEIVDCAVTATKLIKDNESIALRAVVTFTDSAGEEHEGGTLWSRRGPLEYIPRVEEECIGVIESVLILPNRGLKLCAETNLVDGSGVRRRAGQSWLVTKPGHYLRGPYEKVVEEVKAVVITDTRALRLRAVKPYTDVYGVQRKPGEQWLVTKGMADSHIPGVHEQVVSVVSATVLSSRQFCFILNPVADGQSRFGHKERRVGPASFFLLPNEELEDGIHDIYVLGDQEALLVAALYPHTDKDGKDTPAGTKWLVHGPCDFIPEIWQKVVEERKAISLNESQGIYVRNLTTGEIRSVIGQSYMLQVNETLWEMELDDLSEKLVQREVTGDDFQVFCAQKKSVERCKHMVVSISVPHNSATQIFDYKTNESRVVFGPERVMLSPDEKFTVVNLSGGIPKRENDYQSLSLRLGPDFMRDKILVETLDHARLSLKLSYRWVFELREKNQEEGNKLFKVRDFIGNTCKTLASRIRGAVSGKTFEIFHMHSSDIIRNAVFRKRRGEDAATELRFPINNLVITSVDVLSVKPVDRLTKECLKKSITMAIEITTDQYKMKAEQQSALQKQQASGLLSLQKVSDQVEAERAFSSLRQLEATSLTVQKTGKMTADATTKSQSRKIELESELTLVELQIQAEGVKFECERLMTEEEMKSEESYQQELNALEIEKQRKLAEIEGKKFKDSVEALGRETIKSVAKAGPELQAKLLKGLGLKGFMVTSGKNPINLFSTASGLIGSSAQH